MAWLRQLIVACAVPNTILVSGTITHPRYIDPAKKWVGPAYSRDSASCSAA